MTREEILNQVLRGRLLLVGEFRGARAENAGYVDQQGLAGMDRQGSVL
jgi:hypothetical protein